MSKRKIKKITRNGAEKRARGKTNGIYRDAAGQYWIMCGATDVPIAGYLDASGNELLAKEQ